MPMPGDCEMHSATTGFRLPNWPLVEIPDTPDGFLNRDAPQIDVGGATIFELNVEEFVKL
jgi:hypothetical protein